MSEIRSLNRQGAWLIAGSLLLLCVVAGVVAWRSVRTPRLDPVTLCEVGQSASGEVVILLDVTDPLTPEQQDRLTEWLREFELTKLHPNECLSLWVLGTGEDGGLERRFRRCYPGRETDPILHNPAMSAAACDSLFTRPLAATLVVSAPVKRSRYSLLLEAIREISEQPELDARSGPRRLIVISDLRQNTPNLSFYDGVPRIAVFQRSRLFAQVRADLQGMWVDVLYLPRGAWDVCTPDLRDFWRAYLTACGAAAVSFRRL
jgi:hypothetical protein